MWERWSARSVVGDGKGHVCLNVFRPLHQVAVTITTFRQTNEQGLGLISINICPLNHTNKGPVIDYREGVRK